MPHQQRSPIEHGYLPPRKLAACLAAAALLLSACTIDAVAVTPLRGAQPTRLLVLPARNATGVPDLDLRSCLTGADAALRSRGYSVLPLEVGLDLVRNAAAAPAEPEITWLRRLQADTAIDAALIVEVAVWQHDEQPTVADWDWTWRLVEASTGAELWTFTDAGAWRRPLRPAGDLMQPLDAEPRARPFGSQQPMEFHSPVELVQALHRRAMARLPRWSP